MPKSREVHLTSRPSGMPTDANFALVERDVPDAADGEVLVQNLYMSVDPAMRPRLTAGQALDEPMMGGALGRVVQSRSSAFHMGDLVSNRMGFREFFTSDGKGLTKLTPDPDLPLTVHPFILRGVILAGISSQNLPAGRRNDIWQKLAGEWKPQQLDDVATEIGLEQAEEYVQKILKGEVVGRTIVRVS